MTGRAPSGQALVPTASSPSVSTKGFDPSRKCECDDTGQLNPDYADLYDAELELPYVTHAPDECRCTNGLAQYRAADGSVRWLCSCCHTFAHKRLASAIEARSDATGTGAAEGESATRQGDAQ